MSRRVGVFTVLVPILLLVIGLSILPVRGLAAAAPSGTPIPPATSTLQPPVPLANSQGELATPQLILQAVSNGEVDRETGARFLAFAFGAYDKLPPRFHSIVPWDGTLYLRYLQQELSSLQSNTAQAEVASVLSGACGASTTALPNAYDSTYFHIEYGATGASLTIQDYADSLDQTWQTEVKDFGWAPPPVFNLNPAPGGHYHVRLDSLYGGLYGYVANNGEHAGLVGDNPATSWTERRAFASCMVLNQDFSYFPGAPLNALHSTVAHEFNHAIQFGYLDLFANDAPQAVYIEGGATWMEDEVFDDSNDNYNYLWPTFDSCLGAYDQQPYGYWIVFRGLTESLGHAVPDGGEQVMQRFWELSSQRQAQDIGALSLSLQESGISLDDSFHNFAIAAKFSKSCQGGYGSPYCLGEGAQYAGERGLPRTNGSIAELGGDFSDSLQDHYASQWVGLPASDKPYDVLLENTSTGGQLRASLACDTGSTLQVTSFPAIAGAGETVTLEDFDPAGCSSLVLVITNQAHIYDNPSACTLNSYKVRVLEPGTVLPAPSPTPRPTDDSVFHSGALSFYFPIVSR
jgi:hypothetical protein